MYMYIYILDVNTHKCNTIIIIYRGLTHINTTKISEIVLNDMAKINNTVINMTKSKV